MLRRNFLWEFVCQDICTMFKWVHIRKEYVSWHPPFLFFFLLSCVVDVNISNPKVGKHFIACLVTLCWGKLAMTLMVECVNGALLCQSSLFKRTSGSFLGPNHQRCEGLSCLVSVFCLLFNFMTHLQSRVEWLCGRRCNDAKIIAGVFQTELKCKTLKQSEH